MSSKLYIVRHVNNAEVARLIEAKTRGRVENAILEDYVIEAVKGTNATAALKLQSEGVKTEVLAD